MFSSSIFFFFFSKNIYLFLATLSLRFYTQAFSSCSKWGLLSVAVHRLLIVVGLFCCKAQILEHGLSGCGARA